MFLMFCHTKMNVSGMVSSTPSTVFRLPLSHLLPIAQSSGAAKVPLSLQTDTHTGVAIFSDQQDIAPL